MSLVLFWVLPRGRRDKRHGSENRRQSSPKTPTTDRNWQKKSDSLRQGQFTFKSCGFSLWQWHLFLTKQATDRVVNERQSDTRPSLGRPLFNCADCQRDATEESLLIAHFTVVCSVTWSLSRREAGGDLQSWTKVLRQIHKTNAFQLTMEFCIWMKTPFSSVVTPSPPKQCCKTLRGCLFVSNIEKGGTGGGATLNKGREENLHLG